MFSCCINSFGEAGVHLAVGVVHIDDSLAVNGLKVCEFRVDVLSVADEGGVLEDVVVELQLIVGGDEDLGVLGKVDLIVVDGVGDVVDSFESVVLHGGDFEFGGVLCENVAIGDDHLVVDVGGEGQQVAVGGDDVGCAGFREDLDEGDFDGDIEDDLGAFGAEVVEFMEPDVLLECLFNVVAADVLHHFAERIHIGGFQHLFHRLHGHHGVGAFIGNDDLDFVAGAVVETESRQHAEYDDCHTKQQPEKSFQFH